MTPTSKPATSTPARPPGAQNAPAAPHGPMLPPKGASFVNVLASLTPALAPKGTPVAPNGCMMQASQPHAMVTAVHPDAEKRAPYKRPDHESGEELDPAMRQTAQLAPPLGTMTTSAESETSKLASQTRVSLEDLVPQLVKKIAWSGDSQRGTVRMELGAGELAGATLTVSADAGRVSVHVQTPPGTDVAAWRDRLKSRLEGRGLSLESVSVE